MRRIETLKECPTHVDCCEWSADDQVAVFTPSVLWILKLKIAKTYSEKEGRVDKKSIENKFPKDDSKTFKWNSITSECFRKGCWSPLGVDWNGGCMLAVNTTFYNVHIYSSSIDNILSRKILVNPLLKDWINQKKYSIEPFISAVAWTEKVDNHSFMLFGTCDGHLIVAKYGELIEFVSMIKLDDSVSLIKTNHLEMAVSTISGSIYVLNLNCSTFELSIVRQNSTNDLQITCISFTSESLVYSKSNLLLVERRNETMQFELPVGTIVSGITRSKDQITVYSLTGGCFAIRGSQFFTDSFKSTSDIMIHGAQSSVSGCFDLIIFSELRNEDSVLKKCYLNIVNLKQVTSFDWLQQIKPELTSNLSRKIAFDLFEMDNYDIDEIIRGLKQFLPNSTVSRLIYLIECIISHHKIAAGNAVLKDSTTTDALAVHEKYNLLKMHQSKVQEMYQEYSTSVNFINQHEKDAQILLMSHLNTNQEIKPETCPICETEIKFSDPWIGTCLNSHPWGRCGLSMLIIGSNKFLTCQGCESKVIYAENGFERYLFDQNKTCIFCGCLLSETFLSRKLGFN